MEELRKRVIDKLNAELGGDVKNLSKCHEMSKKLQEEKSRIEKSLSLASSEVPSKVSAAVRDVEEASKEIDLVTAKFDSLSCVVQSQLMKVEASTNKMKEFIGKIDQLDHALAYLCCVKDIEDISTGMDLSILEQDDLQSVEHYVSLCDLYKRLRGSSCCHLIEYLKNTLHYWHNQLKDKFSSEFEAVLSVIKWPFLRTDSVFSYPSPEGIQQFQLLCEYLLQLQLPDDPPRHPSAVSALVVDFAPPSLPVALLLRPLQKRFAYHFYGARQTNRIDKPEWFFTQVLTWIRDHENFVQLKVQPVMNKLGFGHMSARTELLVGLVRLAVDKLHAELPNLEDDRGLLAHAVDETLSFARELVNSYGYPASQPSIIGVLTQARTFAVWIHMEKKSAVDKMDAMLMSPTAWSTLGTADPDEFRVPECGESFLSLLQTVTDRSSCLPQPGHRLQFLQLQLELLDDFRVRLLQLLHVEPPDPLASKLPVILNTVSYVGTVLAEWGTLPGFLQLHFYKAKSAMDGCDEAADESGTVFDETCSLYARVRDEQLGKVCESVVLEIVARSRPYRKDRWYAMPSPRDLVNPTLTPSVCPMFQVLAAKLHQLKQSLSASLFDTAWRSVARQLNQFIYEEVVLQNCFNNGGAMQFQFDMTRNLFPLFGQYSNKPETLFPEVRESCVLLCLPTGSALLLRETLTTWPDSDRSSADSDQSGGDDVQGAEALAEVGVHRLSGDKALTVLHLRTDFTNL